MSETQLHLGVAASALSPDPRDAARAARSLGFRGVQLDAVTTALNVTDLSQTGRRELRHVLTSSDQHLIGLRAAVDANGLGPGADLDRLLAQFTKILEAAKGLSAPLVCLDIGALPEPPKIEQPRPQITPEQAGLIVIPTASPPPPAQESRPAPGPDPALVAQVDSALFELGARADRVGVTVAFRSDLASYAAIERALAAARCPWFGLDLDPVAILRDEWSIDEIFSRLGPLIRHVRGRDAVVGADRRTRAAVVGAGSTRWDDLLGNLDAAGYRGWITVDPTELPDRPAAAASAAKHLRAARR
jgi:sugar phosphate isomerase/epimerase